MYKKMILIWIVLCFFSVSIGAQNYGLKITTIESYITSANPSIKTWQKKAITKNIIKHSIKSSMDPFTLIAIIENESHFKYWTCSKNPNTGRRQSCGLMQVNLWEWIYNKNNKYNLIKRRVIKSKIDLFNIYYNIKAGVYIFDKTQKICEWWQMRTEWEGQENEEYPYPNFLIKMGYEDVFECTIASYNGSKDRHKYFKNVNKSISKLKELSHNS